MPDDLTCAGARSEIASYLNGEARPALAAHLGRCEACLEVCLEAALRRPAEVRIPEGFSVRVMARIPETPRPRIELYPWALAAVGFAAVGAAASSSGGFAGFVAAVTGMLAQPAVLATAVGVEAVLTLWWLYRVLATED